MLQRQLVLLMAEETWAARNQIHRAVVHKDLAGK